MLIREGLRDSISAVTAMESEGRRTMNTSHSLSLATAGILLTLLLASCSELKKDLPAPTSARATIHEAGWNDTTSANFHGRVLQQQGYDLNSCVSCHAQSFTGGTSNTSCFRCHSSYPHKPGWTTDTASASFHGKFVLMLGGNLSNCAQCHGATYTGGTSGKSCFTCHGSYPHNAGWLDVSTANSHGKYLKARNWAVAECAACHGANFTSVLNGVTCYTCHASFPHPDNFETASGHPVYLYTNGYPLDQCKVCHGASYTGGPIVNVSCTQSGCHVDASGAPKSPEACNTCHGTFSAAANDFLSAAPPKSVLGDTATTSRGVGAHQRHLRTGILGKPLKCQECHTVPAQLTSPGHIGSAPPAEVVFNDTLAQLVTAGGTFIPHPAYNTTTQKCNNTYCHGNWVARRSGAPADHQYAYVDTVGVVDPVMTGANYSPLWTGGGSEAQCGSCHALPPQGHIGFGVFQVTVCGGCHTGVVDGNGKIIDRTKHINGKIDALGTQRGF